MADKFLSCPCGSVLFLAGTPIVANGNVLAAMRYECVPCGRVTWKNSLTGETIRYEEVLKSAESAVEKPLVFKDGPTGLSFTLRPSQ